MADQVRGKPVGQALKMLEFSPRRPRSCIKKVLESAIANAEHNNGADVDELKVKTIMVDEGPQHEALHRPRQGPRQSHHRNAPATSPWPSAS